MKTLFFINSRSGNNASDIVEKAINSECARNNIVFNIHSLPKELEKDDIWRKIKLFNPEVVGVAGGDGTVNFFADLLKNTGVSLLIIPAGSANGMARELGITGVDVALDLLCSGKILSIDLLKVNDHTCIHLADVGFNARIVKRFEQDPKRGIGTYARHMLSELFLLRPHRFWFDIEGRTIMRRAVSVTFANASKYGTGMVINPVGKLNDGKFELVIIKPFPMIQILSLTWKLLRGTLESSDYVEVISCKQASVKIRKKTTLQIDGEVINKTRQINLEVLPQSIKMLVPSTL